MLIRKMEASDLDAVCEIEKTCFSRPWSKDGFQEAILMERNVFLVACDEESVVGYAGMYVSFDEGEITNVAVKPSMRRKGISQELLMELVTQAQSEKLLQIFLEVRVSNEAAIGSYQKIGFEQLAIRKGFYDFPKEDAYVMALQLEQI